MAIARITGPGLAAMTLSVVALWGSFLTEQRMIRRSQHETARYLYELRLLQRRRALEPAAAPMQRLPLPLHPSAG